MQLGCGARNALMNGICREGPDLEGCLQPFEGFHHHDDQGTFDRPHDLTVQFDPPKIDSLLLELGEKPWTVKRPTLIPDIEVKGEDPPVVSQFEI